MQSCTSIKYVYIDTFVEDCQKPPSFQGILMGCTSANTLQILMQLHSANILVRVTGTNEYNMTYMNRKLCQSLEVALL